MPFSLISCVYSYSLRMAISGVAG